ncbi:isochorismatase family protein [Candidatus Woesearchaeota archaeon]|nr:isochorismatase family protein [Candidatus Woesearchaeota archaeon]
MDAIVVLLIVIAINALPEQKNIELKAKTIESTDNTSKTILKDVSLPVEKTAIIVVDMWDTHRCRTSFERTKELAKKIDYILKIARLKGIQIIHAPSDTMDYYRDYEQRESMFSYRFDGYRDIEIPKPRLIEGSCDGPSDGNWPPKKQISSITIFPEDLISDNANEISGFLKEEAYENIIYVGVHANICIIERQIGIIPMSARGFNTYLVRDLTDVINNPEQPPFVTNDEALNIILEYIETNLSPTITAIDFID